jgi:hypothetical protein
MATAGYGREYSFAREWHDRLLYFAFQPVSNFIAGRLLMTDTVEKLGFASDPEIHEEFCSILRATCSLG